MRQGFGLLALMLVAAAPPPAYITGGTDAQRAALDQAEQLIVAKKAAEALPILEPVVAQLDGQARTAQATSAVFCAGDAAETARYATLAAAQNKPGVVFGSELCDALFFRAYALTELGRKPEAVAALERLVALAPTNAHYYVELAYAYRVNGQLDKARGAYQQAVDQARWSSDKAKEKRFRAAGWRGLGYLLIDEGKLDEAADAYRRSQQDDPDSPVARSELAFIAQRRAK